MDLHRLGKRNVGWSFLFASIIFISHAYAGLVSQQRSNAKPTHPFINIEANCNDEGVLIMASLKEPFYGILYADGYPDVPACQVEGSGRHLLRLSFNVSDCGLHFMDVEDGARVADVSIYVQYDEHVQQAVDERITTRCRLIESVKDSADPPHGAVIEKTPRQGNAVPIKLPRFDGSITRTLPLTNYQLVKAMEEVGKSRELPAVISSSTLHIQIEEKVSCWMDIVSGDNPNNRPVDTYLHIGQEATLVVKVHQPDGLDTRLTSCWAHDGSHEKKQLLLDADGCSVDASILANVQQRPNPHSGVKLLFAKFRAFKFPGRDHLHFKCTVLVCKDKCPVQHCNLIRRKGRDVISTASGRHTPVGKGQLKSIRGLIPPEASVSSSRSASRWRNNDRASESSSVKSANLTSIVRNYRQSAGIIVDRVEVFNSVEVKTLVRPQSQASQGSPRSTESRAVVDSTETIFCLTPSTLFMSFGIVFGVLIVIIMCAVCVCIRFRNKQQKVIQRNAARFSPTYSPPPCTPMPMGNRSPNMSPTYSPTYMRYPNFNRHQSISPYVRVLK